MLPLRVLRKSQRPTTITTVEQLSASCVLFSVLVDEKLFEKLQSCLVGCK